MEFLQWILKTLGKLHIKLPGIAVEQEEDYIFPPHNVSQKKTEKKPKRNIKPLIMLGVAFIIVLVLLAEFVFIPLIARSQAREGENALAAAQKDAAQYDAEKASLSKEEQISREFTISYEYKVAASILGSFNASYAYRFVNLGERTVVDWGIAEAALGYTQRAVNRVENYLMKMNEKITNKDMFYYYLAKWYRSINASSASHYVELSKNIQPPTLYSAAAILDDAVSHSNIDNRISALNTVLQTYSDKFPQIVVSAEIYLGDAYKTKGYSEPNFFSKAVAMYEKAIEDIKQEHLPQTEINRQTIDAMKKIISVYRLEMAFDPSVLNEAISACDNAISLASGSKSVESIYFEKAQIYFDAGDWADAIESFTSANTLFPNSPYQQKSLWEIGKAYANLGKNEISVTYLTMAIAVNPDNPIVPSIMLDLGANLEKTKQYKKAMNVYKAILNRSDVNKYVETEAQRRLASLKALYGG